MKYNLNNAMNNTKLSRNVTSHQVTHDKYKVHHIRSADKFCDLHLLAHNKDDSEQVLIPVDKQLLINSIEYFANIFKETSNFDEKNVTVMVESNNNNNKKRKLTDEKPPQEIKTPKSTSKEENEILVVRSLSEIDTTQLLKIQIENPTKFAEYIGTIYGHNSINLTPNNCVDFHKIVDYLKDYKMISDISEFIAENIFLLPGPTIIQLADYTEKFDKEIIDSIENDHLSIEYAYKLGQLTDRFNPKIEACLKNISKTVESIKFMRSHSLQTFLGIHARYDLSCIKMTAEDDKITFTRMKKVFGCNLKNKANKTSWINFGIIIFPINSVKSYKVTVTSLMQPQSCLAGWSKYKTKKDEWIGHPDSNNNWGVHSSKNGNLYYDNKKGHAKLPRITWNKAKQYSAKAETNISFKNVPNPFQPSITSIFGGNPKNTSSEGATIGGSVFGRPYEYVPQLQHIVVKKEENCLSWSQGDQKVESPFSDFGYSEQTDLYPAIILYNEGNIIEISNVEM